MNELSSKYGVSEVTIYKWIKKYSPISLEDGTAVIADEFVKLQKQIRRFLQEENEILKKAMVIFARKEASLSLSL